MISAKAGPTEEEAIFLQDLWGESLIWFLCVHSWTLCNINPIMAFPSLTPFCASPLLLGSKPESFNGPPGPCITCPCMIFLTSNPFTHPLFSPLLCLTLSHSRTVCAGLYLDHSFPPSFSLSSLPSEPLLIHHISVQMVLPSPTSPYRVKCPCDMFYIPCTPL